MPETDTCSLAVLELDISYPVFWGEFCVTASFENGYFGILQSSVFVYLNLVGETCGFGASNPNEWLGWHRETLKS